jgi:hypothetical protein
MYKNNIFFIILYFSLLYSCCNDNENMYKPINGNDLKEGDYYEYDVMTISKRSISGIEKGIYIVYFNNLNRGKYISDVLKNYDQGFKRIHSELIDDRIPEVLIGGRFSFYYDTTKIINLIFSIESKNFLDMVKNKKINYWDYLLNISDYKILTLLIDLQKYVNYFPKFDTCYVGGANFGDRKMYFDHIKPLDSINMIKYGKKFIKF